VTIRWHYGSEDTWRNMLASVVHATHRLQGDWVSGCQFDEPLLGRELRDFLTIVENVIGY
jgi:hypothetical protein